MSVALPELVSSYAEFIDFRNQVRNHGTIDLGNLKWLGSTGVLLLAYLKDKFGNNIVSESTSQAKSYFDQMTRDPAWWTKDTKLILNRGRSYIPFSKLPKKEAQFKILTNSISDLIKSYTLFGGKNALKYVLGEITDNIYQHSHFKNSYMMSQAYKTKRYVELSFIDDGISIPGNFQNHKIPFKGDWDAIFLAVNEGKSTKDDNGRGTGLGSSLRIYCEGAHAEAMIVSRKGLYYRKAQEEPRLYRLNDQQKFSGSLISIRIPMDTKIINIYNFLE